MNNDRYKNKMQHLSVNNRETRITLNVQLKAMKQSIKYQGLGIPTILKTNKQI